MLSMVTTMLDKAFATIPDGTGLILHSDPVSYTHLSARMLIDAYDSAGIQPSYKVLALTDLYRNEGLKLPTPPLEVDELTYDFTEMAEADVYKRQSKPWPMRLSRP